MTRAYAWTQTYLAQLYYWQSSENQLSPLRTSGDGSTLEAARSFAHIHGPQHESPGMERKLGACTGSNAKAKKAAKRKAGASKETSQLLTDGPSWALQQNTGSTHFYDITAEDCS